MNERLQGHTACLAGGKSAMATSLLQEFDEPKLQHTKN